VALARNLDLVSACILTGIAAILFAGRDGTQARLVGADLGFAFCHRSLLLGNVDAILAVEVATAGVAIVASARQQSQAIARDDN
jgi:hypothetical protein